MQWLRKINFALVIVGIVSAGVVAIALLMIFHTPRTLPPVSATSTPVMGNEQTEAEDATDSITLPEGTVSVALVLEPYEEGVLPELDAVYENHYAFSLADITSLGNEAQVLMHARDLNHDGSVEVIASVYSPVTCGTRGCEAAVYTVTEGEVQILGEWANIPLEGIYVLSSETEGWSDLAFGPGTLGYGIFRMNVLIGRYENVGVAEHISQ